MAVVAAIGVAIVSPEVISAAVGAASAIIITVLGSAADVIPRLLPAFAFKMYCALKK